MAKKKNWNLWSKLRTCTRREWMWSPQRREALKAAKLDKTYLCALCTKFHPKWAVEVDHITPCGAFASWEEFKGYCERLFEGQLRVLCKPCHADRKKEPAPKGRTE